MKNKEHFNDLPLHAALAKYDEDLKSGLDYDWSAWLEVPFADFSKGKVVRGRFFTHEQIEEKIRKMDSRKVTGFLLEWKDEKTGEWFGSEFEPEHGSGDSRYLIGDEVSDDWFDNEIEVGFFKELPNVWFGNAEDWDFRLGVDFDCYKTPEESAEGCTVWEGTTKGGCNTEGEPWRVRKITIGGELSEKAKEFIRRNPDVEFDYTKV